MGVGLQCFPVTLQCHLRAALETNVNTYQMQGLKHATSLFVCECVPCEQGRSQRGSVCMLLELWELAGWKLPADHTAPLNSDHHSAFPHLIKKKNIAKYYLERILTILQSRHNKLSLALQNALRKVLPTLNNGSADLQQFNKPSCVHHQQWND